MVKDVAANESTTANYELLCDIENILGLICLLPMLEALKVWTSMLKT